MRRVAELTPEEHERRKRSRRVSNLTIDQHERRKRQCRKQSKRWREAHPTKQRDNYAALDPARKRERNGKYSLQQTERLARFSHHVREENSAAERFLGRASIVTLATLKRPRFIVQMPRRRPWLETLDTDLEADEDTGDD